LLQILQNKTQKKSNITPNATFKNTKTKIKSIRKNSKNPKHKSKQEIQIKRKNEKKRKLCRIILKSSKIDSNC